MPRSSQYVGAKAGRNYFQLQFACRINKQNPPLSVVVAIRAILLLAKDLDDRMFPLLGEFFRDPNVDKDVVKPLEDSGVIEF